MEPADKNEILGDIVQPPAQNFIRQDAEQFRKELFLKQQLELINKSRQQLRRDKEEYQTEKMNSKQMQDLTPQEQ